MKRMIVLMAFLFSIVSASYAQQQLLSYELVRSYTVQELDSLVNQLGNGANLLISPQYDVDYYKISYLTPYRHPDSLVKATGAIILPSNASCPLPMVGYGHGTQSDRNGSPSVDPGRGETLIGIILASTGYVSGHPDYLGLGESDSSIIIHPYITAFHQGHSVVNMLRSIRELADTLDFDLNGQLFLTGYSQGGFTTAATHKLIEEQYPNEFQITASAPMSGPYDLKVAQVELMASDSVYSTPGYLPYIILGYQSYYGNLYDSVQQIFKSPYDSLMPALFYGGQKGIGFINGLATPVPKDMILDSVVQQFTSDSLHPLRVALADNHLLDWAPQAPIKIHYCTGDDQVTYLNALAAYDSWTTNGSQNVEIEDFGNLNHGDCVLPSVLNAKFYLDSYKQSCPVGIRENDMAGELKIFPNPAKNYAIVQVPDMAIIAETEILVHDLSGKEVLNIRPQRQLVTLQLGDIDAGMYMITVQSNGQVYRAKLMVQ